MTNFEKIVQKFICKPESLRYGDIRQILLRNGFSEKAGKGSHMKFTDTYSNTIVIPVHNRDCLSVYKRETLSKLRDWEII